MNAMCVRAAALALSVAAVGAAPPAARRSAGVDAAGHVDLSLGPPLASRPEVDAPTGRASHIRREAKPGGAAHALGGSLLEGVDTSLQSCYERGFKYEPIDMPGGRQTIEASLQKCQQRCAGVAGCAHFSYLRKTGGCHLQDSKATRISDWQATAGPPSCSGRTRSSSTVAAKAAPAPSKKLEPDPHALPAKACAKKWRKWLPDLPGHKPTNEWTLDKCQARCARVKSCHHYTFFQTKSVCHLQGKFARSHSSSDALSGPPFCKADAPSLPSARLQEAEDCTEINVKYHPLNMPGRLETREATISHCQARCRRVQGCAHFTYTQEGTCHLQDVNAKKKLKSSGFYAGPPKCKA